MPNTLAYPNYIALDLPATVTGDTSSLGRNVQPSDPAACGFPDTGAGSEAVFFVHLERTTTACLDTAGDTSLDTVLYIQSECGGADLACNDDGGNLPGYGSQLEFTFEAGQGYFIIFDQFGFDPGGTFQLNITEGACR